MMRDPIVIVAAKRSPIGNLLGTLTPFSAPQLGGAVIQGILEEVSLDPKEIHEVYMGCVLPAGMGQAPARQAAIDGGIPNTVGATTLNKVCGSSMKATMIAHDLIAYEGEHIIVAGGMESMTNAPYLLLKIREGYRFGPREIQDHMSLDGLENA